MGSGDTPRRSDFALNAIKKPPEIDGGAVLTGSEGHDTSGGKITTGKRNERLPNSQRFGSMILGTQNQHISLSLRHFQKPL